MFTEPIEETYFNWLCSKVVHHNRPSTPSLAYWKLLRILYSTEFVWFIPNDDNRVSDGLELRTYFLRESNCESDRHWESQGCSVLEMLIAFADRAEFQTGISSVEWFWKFLENLDLTKYNDASFDIEDVSSILEIFIWRMYEPNGIGGLFPINRPTRDQKDVELYYQFCEYLEDQDL